MPDVILISTCLNASRSSWGSSFFVQALLDCVLPTSRVLSPGQPKRQGVCPQSHFRPPPIQLCSTCSEKETGNA